MSLSIVPDPAEQSLSGTLNSQIDRLSELVDRAIDGGTVEQVDAIAKLVASLAKLIEAKTKAEQSIKPAALTALMAGMASVVNAHVTAPDIRSVIRRDWHQLSKELAG